MKNVLIINLRRHGDHFASSHLVNSISSQEPNTQIHLLIYEEFKKSASLIPSVTKIHSINRKKIVMSKENKLFNNGLAFEFFYKELQSVTDVKWDVVFNYSNDKVGSYLTSYLDASTKQGVYIGDKGTVKNSSFWSKVFNNVVPDGKIPSFNFNDYYHLMAQTENISKKLLVKTKAEKNQKATDNFNDITKEYGSTDLKFVGIQLKTSAVSKDIPEDIIVNLISEIKTNSDYYPLLLIAPMENEREIAIRINGQFNDDLLIVETTFDTLPSVLLNLHLLVTPDTSVKHMADLTSTPMIEVSLGKAPTYKQHSIRENNFVLTDTFCGNETTNKTNVIANDIFQCISLYFNRLKESDLMLSNSITLYRVQKLHKFSILKPIAGDMNVSFEISRIINQRLLLSQGDMDFSDFDLFLKDHFKAEEIKGWIKDEKTQIIELVKAILSTLRSLKMSSGSKGRAKKFLNCLDRILQKSDIYNPLSSLVILFRADLEAIETQSFQENAVKIESLLYQLKNFVQNYNHIIDNIEMSLSQKDSPRITEGEDHVI